MRRELGFLAFVIGCSGSSDGDGSSGASDCEAISKQICDSWNQAKPDGGGETPCNPPALTPVDFTAVCAKADEKCQAPASAIALRAEGSEMSPTSYVVEDELQVVRSTSVDASFVAARVAAADAASARRSAPCPRPTMTSGYAFALSASTTARKRALADLLRGRVRAWARTPGRAELANREARCGHRCRVPSSPSRA